MDSLFLLISNICLNMEKYNNFTFIIISTSHTVRASLICSYGKDASVRCKQNYQVNGKTNYNQQDYTSLIQMAAPPLASVLICHVAHYQALITFLWSILYILLHLAAQWMKIVFNYLGCKNINLCILCQCSNPFIFLFRMWSSGVSYAVFLVPNVISWLMQLQDQ